MSFGTCFIRFLVILNKKFDINVRYLITDITSNAFRNQNVCHAIKQMYPLAENRMADTVLDYFNDSLH